MAISQDIILKRTGVANTAPLTTQIDFGELAINYNDGKIHYKNTANNIIAFLDEPGVRALNDPGNTFYVSKSGNDDNTGRTWASAFATVEKAIEACQVMYDETGDFTLIEIGPGEYRVEGHIDMPDNCTIRSAYRSVSIKPKNIQVVEDSGVYTGETVWCKNRNVFRMGSGSAIEGILVEDFQLDNLDDPNEGFAFSFRPGAVIYRTPYVHKIAVRTTPSWARFGIAPPLDRNASPVPNPLVGIGGGVVLADGSVCSQFSIYPNIMTWGATPVVPNGISYCAKKGGLVNAVNAISLWAHKHFYAVEGGQVILSGCTCQFGDYSLVSKGFRHIINPYDLEEIGEVTLQVISEVTTVLTDEVIATIIDGMWQDLVDNGYVDGWTEVMETAARRDAATLIQCIKWVLQSAKEKPMLDFARGLFDVNGDPFYTTETISAFLRSFDYMADQIKNRLSTDEGKDIVTALVTALEDTINNYESRKQHERSLVTAISHTWSVVMAGVALAQVPPARNETTIEESILELDNGVVYASGQDDQGSAIFVGGLKIDADTGELNGPPFDTAVNRIATRTAIARSF